MADIPDYILKKLTARMLAAMIKQKNSCIYFDALSTGISITNKQLIRVRIDSQGTQYSIGIKRLVWFHYYKQLPPKGYVLESICDCLNCGQINHMVLKKQGGKRSAINERANRYHVTGIINHPEQNKPVKTRRLNYDHQRKHNRIVTVSLTTNNISNGNVDPFEQLNTNRLITHLILNDE